MQRDEFIERQTNFIIHHKIGESFQIMTTYRSVRNFIRVLFHASSRMITVQHVIFITFYC